MITSVDVAILKPQRQYLPEFLVYALSNPLYLSWLEAICRGGTRDRVSRSMLGDIHLPVPPLDEQRAIAEFLDRETGRIDALIEKKRRLIELLEEKRTALITTAVTKGLDPDVPLKPSGVEWLGDIPEHWEMRRLKYLAARMLSGPFGSSLTKDTYTSDGYRVYGQEQVIPADFSLGDYYVSESKYREMGRYAVAPGDVLVSCVGTFGKVAVVPDDAEPGIINPRLVLVRPDRRAIAPRFLELVLQSRVSYAQLEYRSHGGTMGVVNLSVLADMWLPLPPLAEQEAMLGRADSVKRNTDVLATQVIDAITRLQEYRAALISAAVTGKIDVRNM